MGIDIEKEKFETIFNFCKSCWTYREFKLNADWNNKLAKIECMKCGNIQTLDLKYTKQYYLDLNKDNN